MKVFVVLLVFAAFYQASAMRIWNWFSSDDIEDVISPTAEVTGECRRLAGWGQCAFYDCLEDRFTCGDDGYTLKISKHFCSKIDRNFGTFDDIGQLWLNRTSICLLSYMLPIYEQDSTTCSAIKDAGITAILNCNAEVVDGTDFCGFVQTNGDAYSALMGRDEILLMAQLGNPRVIGSMVSQAVHCGVSSMMDTVASLGESISNLAGSVVSNIRGWFS
ncbi:uncharacterized protein LOC123556806 [Mercenaria mercenaria]|uniref:uncharacterized protein LOC123556806 n=1 Tax=Mercenaria mercenaria TaxID=6596 RepID=UPI001E1D858B|nr:uncharacterized protein LOC123556806 [Mercenaria mercenaria]